MNGIITVRPVIGPADDEAVDLGSLGVRFLLEAAASEGRVAVVEHWVPARALAAPLHRHSRDDEYSLILKGRMGAQLGERAVEAGPGDFVRKPRGEWHTFWNPGDEECRLLELVTPAGFEAMFKEMAADPEAMAGQGAAALDAKYGIEVDYDSIGRLCARHGVSFPT